MTMKTSYRKIYLFLLLLTSYSCNDLTETNMSIDIISMTKYNFATSQKPQLLCYQLTYVFQTYLSNKKLSVFQRLQYIA